MSQLFQDAPATERIRDSRPKLLARDEALRSCFSGDTAPTSPVDGQFWLDTSGGGAGVLKQRRNGAWSTIDAISTTALDPDGTLAANSDTKVPTQKAVKTYSDNLLAAANAQIYKGVIDCSANPNYPAADAGDTYVVSVAGKIGGASGVNVEANDRLLCKTDSTSSGNQATVGSAWSIVQANIDGAVTGPASSGANRLAKFNGTTGKIIKDSGVTYQPPVTTVANLLLVDAAADLDDGTPALVLGYTTVGDVPCFVVRWNASSSATHDGINVFRPSVGAAASGNGRWISTDTSRGAFDVATIAAMTALPKGFVASVVVRDLVRGGVFVWDGASTATADAGTIFAADAGGTGRWKRQFVGDVHVEWFTGTPTGTDDTTAVAAALAAAQSASTNLKFGLAGTYAVGKLTITSAIRIYGLFDRTIVKRKNSSNDYLFYASSVDGIRIEALYLDGNASNNSSSGSHSAIRLETCSGWEIVDVHGTGWRGTFSSSPVGAMVSAVDGSGGKTIRCKGYDGYDGASISNHPGYKDVCSSWYTMQRCGAVLASGCVGSELHGTRAEGCCTSSAGGGAGILIQATDCKTFGTYAKSNTYGHGQQFNGADRSEAHGFTGEANGVSGLDIYNSSYVKVFGGSSYDDAIRNLEIDSSSNYVEIFGFQGRGVHSGGDVAISIFRCTNVKLYNPHGSIRVWHQTAVASATIAAGGSGYTNGTFTVTVVGGTKLTAAQLSVTVSGGVVTAVNSVSTVGNYWTLPSGPVTVTGLSGGSGATFNLTWTGSNAACAGLLVVGGNPSDTLTLITGAAGINGARLDNYPGTVTEDGTQLASAQGCANYPNPIFSAHKNGTDQTSIANGTNTKITFGTELFDRGSFYDAANSKWIPRRGRVRIEAQVVFSAGSKVGGIYLILVYKNGGTYVQGGYVTQSAGASLACSVSFIDDASGTDYYEVYVYGQTDSTLTVSGNQQLTFFHGNMLPD